MKYIDIYGKPRVGMGEGLKGLCGHISWHDMEHKASSELYSWH